MCWPYWASSGQAKIEKKPSQPNTTCYNINYNDGRLQQNSEYLMLIFVIVNYGATTCLSWLELG